MIWWFYIVWIVLIWFLPFKKKKLHNPIPLRRLFPSHAVADLQVSRGLRRTQQGFKGRDQGYWSDILPRLEDLSEITFLIGNSINMFKQPNPTVASLGSEGLLRRGPGNWEVKSCILHCHLTGMMGPGNDGVSLGHIPEPSQNSPQPARNETERCPQACTRFKK